MKHPVKRQFPMDANRSMSSRMMKMKSPKYMLFREKKGVFHDPATIRRELYNKHLLERNKDGSCYSLGEIPQKEEFLQHYL